MNSLRQRWMWSAAVAAAATAALAGSVGLVGCSAQPADDKPAPVPALVGQFEATTPGPRLAITFNADGTYSEKQNRPCNGNAFCFDSGRFTVDTAQGVATLTSASTGQVTQVPYGATSVKAFRPRLRPQDLLVGGDVNLLNDAGDLDLKAVCLFVVKIAEQAFQRTTNDISSNALEQDPCAALDGFGDDGGALLLPADPSSNSDGGPPGTKDGLGPNDKGDPARPFGDGGIVSPLSTGASVPLPVGLEGGAPASAAPIGAKCAADPDCTGGAPGTERVCSTGSGSCIVGCHEDKDCASGTTCGHLNPTWACVVPVGASCTQDLECNAGMKGSGVVCSTSSKTCVAACHADTDCAGGQVCNHGGATWSCGAPAPPPSATSGAQSSGDGSNANVAYCYFVAKGLQTYQSAGIVGNLMQESTVSIDPRSSQAPSGPGRGIAQWSAGERWDTTPTGNLVSFAQKEGKDPFSLEAQLDFLWWELAVSTDANGFGDLKAASNVNAATDAFMSGFERCNPTYCEQASREQYAAQVLAKYGSSCTSNASSSGTTSGSTGVASSASASVSTCGGGNVNQQASNSAWSQYQPGNAVRWAEANWDNNDGTKCAEFVSNAVRNGGVSMNVTFVPTMVNYLSGVPYEEYSASHTQVSANPGDIVIYSNATGNNFCVYPSGSQENCGHVCIAVSGGSASTGTVDCHNNARQHKPLDFMVAGTADNPDASEISTFRVYHVTKSAAQCSSAATAAAPAAPAATPASTNGCPVLTYPSGVHLQTFADAQTTTTYQQQLSAAGSNASAPTCFLDVDNLLDPSTNKVLPISVNLSQHFTLQELVGTEVEQGWGHFVLMNPDAVGALETFRQKAGVAVSITSGFRSPAHQQSTCKSMCGAPVCPGTCSGTSRHMFGDGFDLPVDFYTSAYQQAACDSHFFFSYLENGDHLHVDRNPSYASGCVKQ